MNMTTIIMIIVIMLRVNLDDVKLAHEVAVLEVVTLGQLLKALASQC